MVLDVAQAYAVAPEIIVSPEVIRKLCWQAYENLEEQAALDEWLEAQNVRQWQSELISTEINKLLFS
jgi:ribonuclease D